VTRFIAGPVSARRGAISPLASPLTPAARHPSLEYPFWGHPTSKEWVSEAGRTAKWRRDVAGQNARGAGPLCWHSPGPSGFTSARWRGKARAPPARLDGAPTPHPAPDLAGTPGHAEKATRLGSPLRFKGQGGIASRAIRQSRAIRAVARGFARTSGRSSIPRMSFKVSPRASGALAPTREDEGLPPSGLSSSSASVSVGHLVGGRGCQSDKGSPGPTAGLTRVC
jgi:hypothetical protein